MHLDLKSAYNILKVEFQTSLPLVGKAYKKLALKFHPDKCKDANAQEKFTQIQKAYEYIKKNTKNEGNLFNDSSKKETESLQQPEPNEFEVQLTLEEIFTGCKLKQKITIKVVDANGIEKVESKTLKFDVKPGQIDGSRIIVDKEGDRYHGKIPANVVFIIREKEHELFKRARFDLEYVAKLTTEQACSRQVKVPTIDGKKLKLTINEVITQGTMERVPGRGLPIPNGNGKCGDLIVKFDIIYEKDKKQDPPIQYDIALTLEQILQGCTKKMKIKRSIVDPFDGSARKEDKILIVEIPAGVESGTKFTFLKEGDQKPETIPADVIFTVQAKTHAKFIRNGADIKYVALISEDEARKGCTVDVPTLDGDSIPLVVTMKMAFNFKIFPDLGLPQGGDLRRRGNLIVRFKVLENIYVDNPIENMLPLTLENILHGCTKQMRIHRLHVDRDDNEVTESKILKFDIKPGTESGTVFRYPRMGDQYPERIPADLVFITREKPNPNFVRNGSDIEYTVRLTRDRLSSGGELDIPTLEGETVKLSLEGILKPTAVKRFIGRGLPFVDCPEKRGNLVVRFEIIEDNLQQDPPVEHSLFLTDEQMMNGLMKRVNITRLIVDSNGNEQDKKKILTIDVQPGTHVGRKFTFEKEGDIRPGFIAADIVFIVKRKSSKPLISKQSEPTAKPISKPTQKPTPKTTLKIIPKLKSRFLPQDPPVEHNFFLTLENILKGCSKRMKIKRVITDEDGKERNEEEIITIEVEPGTEEGKRYVFPRMGDEKPDSIPADIIFIARDKPHDKFVRRGADLQYTANVGANEMFKVLEIPTLEDEIVNITVTALNRNDNIRTIPERGLPYPGNCNQRGDIVVRIVSQLSNVRNARQMELDNIMRKLIMQINTNKRN